MISIVLLFKIICCIGFIVSWVFMYRRLRRTERRLECLKEHSDERVSALAESVERMGALGEPGNEDHAETKRKAIEAERLFTEGIASILNFSAARADDRTAFDASTGKKGE